MKCSVCDRDIWVGSSTGTCPECLQVIIANSTPEPACERCGGPVVEGCKPGLCIDCTADDFGGFCEECGEEIETHQDGLCPECAKDLLCHACGRQSVECVCVVDEEPADPEEEDLITSDHIHFYEQGAGGFPSPAVTVPEGDDWKPHVKRWIEGRKFFPNVWWISDHGDSHLLSLED